MRSEQWEMTGQLTRIDPDEVCAHARKLFHHLDERVPTPGAAGASGMTGDLDEFEAQLAAASTALRMQLTQITQVLEANAVALRTAAQELSEHDQSLKGEMSRLTTLVDDACNGAEDAHTAAVQDAQTAAMHNDAAAYAQAKAVVEPSPVTPTPVQLPLPAATQPPSGDTSQAGIDARK